MEVWLHKFTFQKVVILLGDNSAKVFVYKKNEVVDFIEIKDLADANQKKDLAAILLKNQSLPIYLVVNLSEQTFEITSIPTANPFLFNKLMARKIGSDGKGSEKSVKGFYKISVGKSKKNTSCVLVDMPIISPLEEWVVFLEKISNIVVGIYSFPVELQFMVRDIQEFLVAGQTKKDKKKIRNIVPKWVLYVFQSETSGIRFAVLKDGDLIFTRLLHYRFDDEPFTEDGVGIIKNEILGTIEYLKRLDFKVQDGIDVYLLVSKAFYDVFKTFEVPKYNFVYVDIDSFAKTTLKFSAQEDFNQEPDRFFVRYFLKKGTYAGFMARKFKKSANLFYYNKILTFAITLVLIVGSVVSVIPLQQISTAKATIKSNIIEKNKYTAKLETIREETFGFDIDEDKVIDVASLHTKLMSEAKDPIALIFELYHFLPENISFVDLDWEIYKETKVKLVVTASFRSDGLSFEEIFAQYDAFLRAIKSGFSKYDIDHSDLPDTISFERNSDSIPISIQIVGPMRK